MTFIKWGEDGMIELMPCTPKFKDDTVKRTADFYNSHKRVLTLVGARFAFSDNRDLFCNVNSSSKLHFPLL